MGGRHRGARRRGGLRLIIAYDGSIESEAAIKVVAGRTWPAGTAVRVISVYDQGAMEADAEKTPTGMTFGDDATNSEMVIEQAGLAVAELTNRGIAAGAILIDGDASTRILEEANRWGADAIFIGARGHGLLERAMIGSVSNAVAIGANCSVEVVRIAPLNGADRPAGTDLDA